MKKLIFILSLWSVFANAQSPAARGAIASSIHTATSQTIQLALNNTGNVSGVTGWNDVFTDTFTPAGGTSAFFLNTLGSTTGVKMTIDATNGAVLNYSGCGNPTPPNTDFPNGVASNQWFNGVSTTSATLTFTLTGLTASHAYNVKTYSYDNSGGTGNISVQVGSATPQSGNQEASAGLELTFTSVMSDGSGNLTFILTNISTTNGVINGVIITG